MVFYLLTTIVFIAEIIITYAIIASLFKLSKRIREYTNFADTAKPKIKEISELSRKISMQLTELAYMAAEKVNTMFWNVISNQLKSVLAGMIFIAVKNKTEKYFSKNNRHALL